MGVGRDALAVRVAFKSGSVGGGSAEISDCGRYRYRLSRWWGDKDDPDRAVFVMLNPSTADASNDDPTIRRCIGFAQSHGYWSRNTRSAQSSPRAMAAARSRGEVARHGNRFTTSRPALSRVWLTLGRTKDGHPRHPLYLRGDSQLDAYLAHELAAATR